jgi:hypothetical protein
MRLYKTLGKKGMYKASNFTFDLDTLESKSHAWYTISKRIGPHVILNRYNYSTTTCRHVNKTRAILEQLGIKYIEIECPSGLQSEIALENATDHYYRLCIDLEELLFKPRTREAKNAERVLLVKKYESIRLKIKAIMKETDHG